MKESTKLLRAAEGRYKAYLARKNHIVREKPHTEWLKENDPAEYERRKLDMANGVQPTKELVVKRRDQWWSPSRRKPKKWRSRLEELKSN